DSAGALPPPGASPVPRRATGGRRGRRPVPRPNGELYFPRRLAGATDIDVLRRLRDKKIPVLLYGPPGTGKTAFRVRSACCSRSCCLGSIDPDTGAVIADDQARALHAGQNRGPML